MTSDIASPRRGIFHSAWSALLWAILFAVIFVVVLYVQKPSTLVVENSQVKDIFAKYSVFVGPVLALLALTSMYILAGIKRLVGLRNMKALDPLIVFVVMSPMVAFGFELLYYEKTRTDIARAIIGILAFPLFVSSAIVAGLAFLCFLYCLVRRK